SRSIAAQPRPRTSPLRRPSTRMRTYAAYSESPEALAASRNALASSLVQGTTLRARDRGGVTSVATFFATSSSLTAVESADLRTVRMSLIVRAAGTLLQH